MHTHKTGIISENKWKDDLIVFRLIASFVIVALFCV